MTARNNPRRQCKKCPWKLGADPFEIPNGYCPTQHRALSATIARAGDVSTIDQPLRLMACHETKVPRQLPCVGWLHNQLGSGNNIPLRLAVIAGRVDADVETVGPQHATLEDTFPP